MAFVFSLIFFVDWVGSLPCLATVAPTVLPKIIRANIRVTNFFYRGSAFDVSYGINFASISKSKDIFNQKTCPTGDSSRRLLPNQQRPGGVQPPERSEHFFAETRRADQTPRQWASAFEPESRQIG